MLWVLIRSASKGASNEYHNICFCGVLGSKFKSYSHFFSKNISIYAIFNDQSFNDIVSFEQLGPDLGLQSL